MSERYKKAQETYGLNHWFQWRNYLVVCALLTPKLIAVFWWERIQTGLTHHKNSRFIWIYVYLSRIYAFMQFHFNNSPKKGLEVKHLQVWLILSWFIDLYITESRNVRFVRRIQFLQPNGTVLPKLNPPITLTLNPSLNPKPYS